MSVDSATKPGPAGLLAADELDAGELKACCAAVYEQPAVRWLLAGELHPGGEESTRRALEMIRLAPGDRLLDVASGHGTSAMLAAREFGSDVIGIEYGERSVLAGETATEAEGLADRVSFRRGDAEALPADDDSFDAVLCECSLCTFPDKARAVAEMARVLRPGGRVAISDVVVDPERLPTKLSGSMATIACIGSALTQEGYEHLLAGAGLDVFAVESRREDAANLAQRVEERLRGARLLGLGPLTDSLGLADAIELTRMARRAISDGALGYSILAASR